MAPKQQNFIVGLFVMVGLTVLAGLVVIFGGGKTLLATTYELKADFPEGVSGIQSGQSVTLNGKRIGETKDIHFLDDKHLERGVYVSINIEGFELPAASELIVSPPAMGLGRPIIELEVTNPSATETLPRDGTAHVHGRMLPAIDQLVPKQMQNALVNAATHIGELAASLRPAADNLSRLLEQRDMQAVDQRGEAANVATLVQRLDLTLKSFNNIVGDETNRRNMQELLENAKTISESGVVTMKNVSEASAHTQQLMVDTTGLLRRLTTLAEDMSGLMKRMDSLAIAVNQKTGTIGLMLNDNRLYEEMILTMRRMSKLMDDFRELAAKANRGELRIKAF